MQQHYTPSYIADGDKTRPTANLETMISTLRATLALPAAHENRKLPKDTTTQTQVIHATWERYIDYENIPNHHTAKRGEMCHQKTTSDPH